LVDADKEMLGVFSREDALKKAEEAGLDLVRSLKRTADRARVLLRKRALTLAPRRYRPR
jgi:translation initiation factor IF-3